MFGVRERRECTGVWPESMMLTVGATSAASSACKRHSMTDRLVSCRYLYPTGSINSTPRAVPLKQRIEDITVFIF